MVVVGSGSANESLKARTMEVLSSRGVVQVCVGSVFSPLQLPFAVKKMLAKGGFTAVIVVAAFTEEVRAPFREGPRNRHEQGSEIRMKLTEGAMCVYIRRAGVRRQGDRRRGHERHRAGENSQTHHLVSTISL